MKRTLALVAAALFVTACHTQPHRSPYATVPTAELKLRHAQCVEYLALQANSVNISIDNDIKNDVQVENKVYNGPPNMYEMPAWQNRPPPNFGGGIRRMINRSKPDPKAQRFQEKEKIEMELLHRYQAGDKEAYLPIFGDLR